MRALAATAQRPVVPIESAEGSDRELLLRPIYQRCRALLAGGRGLAAST